LLVPELDPRVVQSVAESLLLLTEESKITEAKRNEISGIIKGASRSRLILV